MILAVCHRHGLSGADIQDVAGAGLAVVGDEHDNNSRAERPSGLVAGHRSKRVPALMRHKNRQIPPTSS
jgi:hypothetical protein